MLFTSLEFLLVFLPITLLVYYVLPRCARNVWLLATSLVFYAWGEPFFVMVMIFSIVVNYVLTLCMARSRRKKAFLVLALTVNFSLLFVYKYANFFSGVIRDLFPQCMGVIPQTSFLLPIGISFFTFQAVSYVIDVYRGNPVQKNPIDLALYIAMFPQLIAGPIVRYETVAQQLKFRRESLPLLTDGVCRFLVGFNKKMLLANLFAICADRFFSLPSLSACGAWLGAIAYTFQIFFDFSGYSDMAIGLGLMFGFRFLENFDYPYISRSVTEFWRRWHMSLGSWFRDYLYFPLGGSRVATRSRLVFNLSVVWFATGFWHGANWTFMLWGALYGGLIIVEKLTGLPQKIESGRIWGCLGWLGTMFFVITGWVLFRADSLSSACVYLKSMFGFGTLGLIDDVAVFEARENLILLALGILCSAPLARSLKNRLPPGAESGHLAHLAKLANLLAQVALFFVSVSYLVMNAHNPFIYFNF